MKKNLYINKQKFLNSWLVIVLVGAFFIFAVQAFIKQNKREKEVHNQVVTLQEEYERVNQRSDFLKKTLTQLELGAYKTKTARQLNMKLEGEEVILFPENVKLISPPEAPRKDDRSNWKKWWDYFFERTDSV